MSLNFDSAVEDVETKENIDFRIVIEKIKSIFRTCGVTEAYCKPKLSKDFIGNDEYAIQAVVKDDIEKYDSILTSVFDSLEMVILLSYDVSHDVRENWYKFYSMRSGINYDYVDLDKKQQGPYNSSSDIEVPDMYSGKLKIKSFGPMPWELTDLEYYRLVENIEDFGVKDLYAILADYKYPDEGVCANIDKMLKSKPFMKALVKDLIQAYKSREKFSEDIDSEARTLVELFVRCNAKSLSEAFPKRYKLQSSLFVSPLDYFKGSSTQKITSNLQCILSAIRVEPDRVVEDQDEAYVNNLITSQDGSVTDYNLLFKLIVADVNLEENDISKLRNVMEINCNEVVRRAKACYVNSQPDDSSVYQFGVIACNILGKSLTRDYPNIIRYDENNPNVWLQIINNCKESIFNILEFIKYSF